MLSILSFPKNENPFSKKVVPFFIWNYCTWKRIFPYKTAQSKTNGMANRMGSIKWTYHKEQGFATNYCIFWKFYFIARTPFKELIYCTNYPNIHISTFCKCLSFIWGYVFPLSIFKSLLHQRPFSYGCTVFCTLSTIVSESNHYLKT